MKDSNRADDPLVSRLKHLVADLFRLDLADPDRISGHEPLIGGELGLDSLDALELAMCIEEEFGVALQGREETRSAFASIASLADHISSQTRKTTALRSVAQLQHPLAGSEMAG